MGKGKKKLIKQAINTTLVIENKQSIDLCVDKILKLIKENNN